MSEISPASSQTRATTPDKVYSSPPVPLLPTPISHSTPVKTKETSAPSNTSVNVKVRWPSQTRERELQPDLQSLGTMLVRGTYKPGRLYIGRCNDYGRADRRVMRGFGN